ncbi:UPF0016 family membrane protein [Frankia sp. CcI49]|nr:UPF0016 family membrane protein [Frankia sp. CcI49]
MPGRRRLPSRPGLEERTTGPVNLTAAFVTFGVIFLAELPDKTMVASLVLGSRFRPLYVWAGVAAAFAVQVTLAVAAGSAISLLPGRAVDIVAALLFALGAVLVLREGREDPDDEAEGGAAEGGTAGDVAAAEAVAEADNAGKSGFLRVAATSFVVVFVAELGDLTQFSTANLAARYSAPVAVWIGAVLALWTVAALAIAGGRSLLRVLSVRLITRVAATAFAVLAVISLIDAIRG